jgi:hypothetical protein
MGGVSMRNNNSITRNIIGGNGIETSLYSCFSVNLELTLIA